jgi:hypothetical protein
MHLVLVPVVRVLEVEVVPGLVVLGILPTHLVSAELGLQGVGKYFPVLVVALDRTLALAALEAVSAAVQAIMFTVPAGEAVGAHLVADLLILVVLAAKQSKTMEILTLFQIVEPLMERQHDRVHH